MNIDSLLTDIYTCAICQRISFPPVKWNVECPEDSTIPKCNHIYCLNCTKLYFELDKEQSERTKKYQCLVCQKYLLSKDNIYFICTQDEDNIVKYLLTKNNDIRFCDSQECIFKTNDPYLMKEHIKNCSTYIKKCKYGISGCNYISKQSELKEHEKLCEYRIVKCILCKRNIINKNKLKHMVQYHYITNSSLDYEELLLETNETTLLYDSYSSSYPVSGFSSSQPLTGYSTMLPSTMLPSTMLPSTMLTLPPINTNQTSSNLSNIFTSFGNLTPYTSTNENSYVYQPLIDNVNIPQQMSESLTHLLNDLLNETINVANAYVMTTSVINSEMNI